MPCRTAWDADALIGVAIGAVIHNWIPGDFIVKLLGTGNPFGVVLGLGCALCHQTLENTKSACLNLGLTLEVDYITDTEKMCHGAMRMPVIVVNEKVASQGKILNAREI